MAKRKPLPYHASQAIDEARMELSDATRLIVSLMDSRDPIDPMERYRRLGLAIDRLHRASAALKEIRSEPQ
jgi:hypothetical protein